MTSSLPTADSAPLSDGESAPQRILVVDDDVTFCKTLAAALRRRHKETLIAHSVSEGRAEAEAWSPDAAVIDLRMPGESGLSLVQWLAARDREMKIVVLTGFGSIATAVEAVKLGATQYLTKPVSVDDLMRAFGGVPQHETDSPAPSLDVVEWEHLQRVLSECQGNVSEAARRLGMHRRSLQRKLARGRQ